MKYLVITDDGKFLGKGGVLLDDRPFPFPSKKRARSQMFYYKVKGDIVSMADYYSLLRLTHVFERIKTHAEAMNATLDSMITKMKESNQSP